MQMLEHRWVYVVWCDDIRQEMGNKPSLMGVYTGSLVIPSFPAVLHKICAHITVGTPRARPYQALSVKLIRSDSDIPLAQMEIPTQELQDAAVNTPSLGPDDGQPRGMALNLAFMLGPVEIQEKTEWFKVIVQSEDELLESFKLNFQAAATPVVVPALAVL